MMTAFLPGICVAILTLFSTSCKKGDTGPAGTANVIFSDWFKPDAYKKDTVFGIWGFNYIKSATDITQNVLDSGAVIVYGKLLGYSTLVWPTTQIAPLPISLTYVQGTTMTDTWSGQPSLGKLRIRFVNDKNFYTTIATAHMFRYIVIPGAKKAATGAAPNMAMRSGNVLDAGTLQDIAANWTHMSYEEVCGKLKIPL